MLLQLSLMRVITKFTSVFLVCFCLVSHAVHGEEFTNFLGMSFVSIPGGTFKMGAASKTFDVKLDELPQHNVRVYDFQIMTTEVTLAQYKRYIIKSSNVDILQDEFMEANRHDNNAPVVYVSWNDIRYFLHWLNQNKPDDDAGEYTLPTEAEWEFACLAGGDELYCGGNKAGDVAWYASKTLGFQQPVAQKKPNAFGLYDMSGNVREWVEDCYHNNYENAPNDSQAWNRNCHIRSTYVTRGGSWEEGSEASRATDRMAAKFNRRDPTIGFRIVRRLPNW